MKMPSSPFRYFNWRDRSWLPLWGFAFLASFVAPAVSRWRNLPEILEPFRYAWGLMPADLLFLRHFGELADGIPFLLIGVLIISIRRRKRRKSKRSLVALGVICSTVFGALYLGYAILIVSMYLASYSNAMEGRHDLLQETYAIPRVDPWIEPELFEDPGALRAFQWNYVVRIIERSPGMAAMVGDYYVSDRRIMMRVRRIVKDSVDLEYQKSIGLSLLPESIDPIPAVPPEWMTALSETDDVTAPEGNSVEIRILSKKSSTSHTIFRMEPDIDAEARGLAEMNSFRKSLSKLTGVHSRHLSKYEISDGRSMTGQAIPSPAPADDKEVDDGNQSQSE